MKPRTLIIGLSSVLLLAGCTLFNRAETPSDDTDTDTPRETRNVLYRGTVEELGASIYMEGTHRLELEDGRFVLLESDDINLDDYLNDDVEVFGSVRPTVEEGGMIMTVESISLASENEDDDTGTGAALSSSSSSEETMTEESSSSVSSAAAVRPSSSSLAMTTSSETSVDPSSAKVESMLRANLDPANWTQEYCSSHIDFCIPVHRNWWYNSFGATSSTLWRIEIGPSEIQSLNEGPISVNLVSGVFNGNDGSIQTLGDEVVGYRTWTNNRHFEIRGPQELRSAISYLTEQLKESAE